jgi:hypothetical protein
MTLPLAGGEWWIAFLLYLAVSGIRNYMIIYIPFRLDRCLRIASAHPFIPFPVPVIRHFCCTDNMAHQHSLLAVSESRSWYVIWKSGTYVISLTWQNGSELFRSEQHELYSGKDSENWVILWGHIIVTSGLPSTFAWQHVAAQRGVKYWSHP